MVRKHRMSHRCPLILLLSTLLLQTLPNSPAAAQASPSPLPTLEVASPAITSLTDGRTDVFTRSSGGDLLHQYRPAGGSWTRTLNLGGDLASQPAAVSWASGRMDVFARGTDNALWHRWYSSGRWSVWESLGGVLASAPAVASWASGRLDVVIRGTTGALVQRSFVSGSGWSGWRNLGGALTSSPTITAWAPGRLDVFARGTGNVLRHKWFTTSAGWSPWETLGGTLVTQPAAASTGEGQLDVVMRGQSKMWLKRFARGSGWTGWTSLEGTTTSGPGISASGAAVRLVAKWSNGRVHERVRRTPTGTWSNWVAADPYRPFRRLGTWVDVFDYAALDPATAVADMQVRGVRVLYLSTARFNGTADFFAAAEAGAWLDAAHAAGIKVVGWYVPAYGDMTRDVRRTVAIADYVSPGGQRFDAIGIDIERFDEVSRTQFNTRLVTHLQRVRAQTDAVMGAIVPSPFATDPGNNWEGFPWAAVGQHSDVILPMALWSFRDSCPGPEVCPYSSTQVYNWVADQITRARSLAGKPVSVEGGVDDPGTERTPVTVARVRAFVDAAIDSRAIGGSHYDYATTAAALWAPLARLNEL